MRRSAVYRAIVVALLLLAMAPPANGQGPLHDMDGGPDCMAWTVLMDASEDEAVRGISGAHLYRAGPADLLGYEALETTDELVLRLTLSEQPPEDPNETYRYWLGFVFKVADGRTYSMNVRIAFTTAYDSGTVVGPNGFGNPSVGEVPIAWNGTTMQASIPKAWLEDMAGEPSLRYGSPHASSDGVHRTRTVQGPGAAQPAVSDYVGESFDFVPLGDCEKRSWDLIRSLAAACPTGLRRDDPRGDIRPGYPGSDLPGTAGPLDILAVQATRVPGSLVMGLTLADRPHDDVRGSYRYGMHFDYAQGTQAPKQGSLLMQHDGLYGHATIHLELSGGSTAFFDVPVTWDGTRFTAIVPLDRIPGIDEEDTWRFNHRFSWADGPFPLTFSQVPPAGVSFGHDDLSSDGAIPLCAAPPTLVDAAVDPGSGSQPAPAGQWLPLMAALLVGGLWRRR